MFQFGLKDLPFCLKTLFRYLYGGTVLLLFDLDHSLRAAGFTDSLLSLLDLKDPVAEELFGDGDLLLEGIGIPALGVDQIAQHKYLGGCRGAEAGMLPDPFCRAEWSFISSGKAYAL